MKLNNIRKIYHNKYNDVEALKGINLDINQKGLIVLLGSSGCGKTTLLNIMSGNDKNFEGTITDIPQVEYLTQDFCFFENMSVIDNLLLVRNDKKLILEYLSQFKLVEHQNKKVKLCSNGQKKRIQFIRALLHQPGMLLCDEPTAALDHDNAELLMNYLKEISKEVQVVLVTHDIALAEKYADRIIQLSEGAIYSDTTLCAYEKLNEGKQLPNKTIKETVSLVFKEFKSRVHESILFVVLSCISILAIFSTFSLYQTINEQADYINSFNNGSNLALSLQKDEKMKKWKDFYQYNNFDLYRYEDIQKVIDNNPNIVAVEAFYNDEKYRFNPYVSLNVSLSIDPLVFHQFTRSDNVTFENRPRYNAFFVSNQMKTEFKQHEEKMKNIEETKYDIEIDQWSKDYQIALYDWVSKEEMPLLYGNLPSKNNEVILAVDTAEMILKLVEDCQSIEDLVGKKITLGMQSYKNNITDVNSKNPNTHCIEEFEVEVKGITSIKNKSMNMIFFNNDFAKNTVMEYFVKDYKELYFQYVRFFVDPSSDVNELVTYLNENVPQEKNEFKTLEGQDIVTGITYYRNPKNFMIFSTSITAVFGLIILLVYLFIRKRFNKEQKILRTYGYSLSKERLLRIGITNTSAFIFVCIFSPFYCNWVNQVAISYKYVAFIKFDLIYILIACLLISCLYFIYEIMIGGKSHD